CDPTLLYGKRRFPGGDTHEDGDQHAWHHAVVDDLARQREAAGQPMEGHREHQIQADQAAQHQGYRGVGKASAGLDLTDQRGDTGADDDAALHGVGDQPHQHGTEAGDAEKQEDHEYQELQGKQRLDGLRAWFEVAEKQQHHGNAGGDPTGYEGHAEQGRQHEADPADHDVGQGDLVGQAEGALQ